MYVTVRIPVESPHPLLRVPVEAVRPGGQIWVKRGKQLKIISAKPAYTFENHALLRAAECDLAVGDEVIVSPLASVTNDLQVITHEELQAQINQNATSSKQQAGTSGNGMQDTKANNKSKVNSQPVPSSQETSE